MVKPLPLISQSKLLSSLLVSIKLLSFCAQTIVTKNKRQGIKKDFIRYNLQLKLTIRFLT
jgi:hypothetical protein